MWKVVKFFGRVVYGFLAIVKGTPLRCLEILGQLLPEDTWSCKVRGLLIRPFLKKCGQNFQLALHAKLEHLGNIEIGDDVYVGHGTWISGVRGGVVLKDQVMIGPYVVIVSSKHTFKNGSSRYAPSIGGKITIGEGTWIASGVIVTAGVNVGKSCLLTGGAVVTKDVPDGSIAGGIPAKVIGLTDQFKLVD